MKIALPSGHNCSVMLSRIIAELLSHEVRQQMVKQKINITT